MADDPLPLNVLNRFVILADYYNTKERILEELQFWYKDQDEQDAFIDRLDKTYLKIMTIRNNKNNKKTNTSINYNFALKLQTLKKTIIALHNTFNNNDNNQINQAKIRLQNVDKCILYYCRGKLKGLPSRIHLQMILYGYSPNKKEIIEMSKHMDEYMDIINFQNKNKMKTFPNKMDIDINHDNSEQKQLYDRETQYNLKHNNHKNKRNNEFMDDLNLNWSPPMSFDTLFYRLSLCSDRIKHKLNYETTFDEISIVYNKSKNDLFNDAMKIIDEKIKIKPKNDWYQTPYKGHPVYIAMHATGTCCRICLGQWFKISERGILTITQMKYIANVIVKWINLNCPPQFC